MASAAGRRPDRVAIIWCFLGGLAVSPALSATAPMIRQSQTMFSVRTVDIRRGDTLQFTNEDPFLHHVFVESPQFRFDSGEQRPGNTVEILFDRAGSFTVQCAIHLKMRLAVTVR
ncbi:MAG: hypothetical protein JNK67_11290 [Alphaproteobacteria bacterium]|nr:hypothetical protein [Alphaproteobacteria bacterium]